MFDCAPCKDTGIWICVLDDTKDVAIQKCDHCHKLASDRDAVKLVLSLVYDAKA